VVRLTFASSMFKSLKADNAVGISWRMASLYRPRDLGLTRSSTIHHAFFFDIYLGHLCYGKWSQGRSKDFAALMKKTSMPDDNNIYRCTSR